MSNIVECRVDSQKKEGAMRNLVKLFGFVAIALAGFLVSGKDVAFASTPRIVCEMPDTSSGYILTVSHADCEAMQIAHARGNRAYQQRSVVRHRVRSERHYARRAYSPRRVYRSGHPRPYYHGRHHRRPPIRHHGSGWGVGFNIQFR